MEAIAHPPPRCPHCDQPLRIAGPLPNGVALRCNLCKLVWYGQWRGVWVLIIWPEEDEG